MRTSNPALGPNTFTGFSYIDQTMTVQGTVNKSALLLLITIISATAVWAVPGLSVIGIFASIPAFILAMITSEHENIDILHARAKQLKIKVEIIPRILCFAKSNAVHFVT